MKTVTERADGGGAAVCRAGPSLALIKYWGKRSTRLNIPATTSLAITLEGLETETYVQLVNGPDQITVDGDRMDPRRFAPFFSNLRRRTGIRGGFDVSSQNNFPTAAGLASSASGFAALALACVKAAGLDIPLETVSALARVGSASAARAVFGGWTLLRAGSRAAEPLHESGFWPDLRVVVVAVRSSPKSVSSRDAMERVRETSPYYRSWVRSSVELVTRALRALEGRDLDLLGNAMRASYMRMFGSMLAANPPVVYWLPESVRVIHACQHMRDDGLDVWETMDAGPQVKILCRAAQLGQVKDSVGRLSGVSSIMIAKIGAGPRCQAVSRGLVR